MNIQYTSESEMGYEQSRKCFKPGESLVFDPSYRLAHLPLVNKNHPVSISSVDSSDYINGTYKTPRYSLVAPVDYQSLYDSKGFQGIDQEFRTALFSGKIAWDTMDKRKDILHITVMGGIEESGIPSVLENTGRVLAGSDSVRFRLGGPFIGSKNLGRVYFPAYPEKKDNSHLFNIIRSANGVSPSNFYVLGYYNFKEELSAEETEALQQILNKGRESTIACMEISRISLITTHDDLALSGTVLYNLP